MTAPATLLRLQAELNTVAAQHTDLKTRIRQRRLVEVEPLRSATIARAQRVRDGLMTAPARHAAVLAAKHGQRPAAFNVALIAFLRTTLHAIAKSGCEQLAEQRKAAKLAAANAAGTA